MPPTDTLPDLDALSDAELNERFAVAYTDWKQVPLVRGDKTRGVVARFQRPEINSPGSQPYTPMYTRFKAGGFGGDALPKATTSPDVVLPLFARFAAAKIEYVAAAKETAFRVDLFGSLDDTVPVGYGLGPTFARAATIALLRAAPPSP